MSTIHDIPSEILRKILRTVEDTEMVECAVVNKLFYSIVNPELWRFPVISNGHQLHQLSCSIETSQGRRHMKGIKFGWNSYVTDKEFMCIVKSAPQLEDIVIIYARDLTDKSVEALAQHCRHLQHFHLSYSNLPSRAIQPLARCLLLKTITFFECNVLSSDALRCLVHLPIAHLTLGGCDWVAHQDTADVIRLFVHLQKLYIEDCAHLPPQFLLPLTAHDHTPSLPHLNVFVLSDPNLTDQHILPFLHSHPHLRVLGLMCPVTDSLLNTMDCPRLISLDIRTNASISSHAVYDLLNRSNHLSKLSLILPKNDYCDFLNGNPSFQKTVFKQSVLDLDCVRVICFELDA